MRHMCLRNRDTRTIIMNKWKAKGWWSTKHFRPPVDARAVAIHNATPIQGILLLLLPHSIYPFFILSSSCVVVKRRCNRNRTINIIIEVWKFFGLPNLPVDFLRIFPLTTWSREPKHYAAQTGICAREEEVWHSSSLPQRVWSHPD